MDRAIPWYIGGAVFVAAVAAFVVMAPEHKNPAFDFIAGNRPVSEDQVRQKLLSFGWANVQIVVRGDTLSPQHQKTVERTPFPWTR